MPRGFLVKRTKRASSYRLREEDAELPTRTPDGALSALGHYLIREPGRGPPGPGAYARLPDEHCADYARSPERSGGSPDSYSPIKPVSAEPKPPSYLDRCLSSPAAAESFPLSAPPSSIQRLLLGRAFPSHPERKSKPPAKKSKAARRLTFEDEVTTSPVLGLKIKKESPDAKVGAAAAPSSGRKKPLGEFICQLCKEEYSDPFSLAQHKCSRIVRVEYRCPECDKVFSCPANLASHRRWHKPRGEAPGGKKAQGEEEARLQDERSVEGKENAEKIRVNERQQQLLLGVDSAWRAVGEECGAPAPPAPAPRYAPRDGYFDLRVTSSDSADLFGRLPNSADPTGYLSSPAGDEELYPCHFCSKKFRRQAYLRKHLSAHDAAPKTPPYKRGDGGQIAFPCQLCGGHFPTADTRDKHRLWHAVREELKPAGVLLRAELNPGQQQQLFSCKHCASTFFSSPGLTRHINKCHPAESPHAMLLQMPVRPGY